MRVQTFRGRCGAVWRCVSFLRSRSCALKSRSALHATCLRSTLAPGHWQRTSRPARGTTTSPLRSRAGPTKPVSRRIAPPPSLPHCVRTLTQIPTRSSYSQVRPQEPLTRIGAALHPGRLEGDQAARVRRQGRVHGHLRRAARQVLRVRVRAAGQRRWAVRVRVSTYVWPLHSGIGVD